MRLLIVEDNLELSAFLSRSLSEEGFVVDTAKDGEDGLRRMISEPYQAVILDWMLPRKSGIDALREARKRGCVVPVLMLTARDEVKDEVQGLNTGADDYLTKPFKFEVLLARLNALTRRTVPADRSPVLKFEDLELDLITHKALWKTQSLELLPKEEAILACFLRNPERVLTRTFIYEQVWNDSSDTYSNSLEVHIKELRRKMEDIGAPRLIQTLRGRGYQFSRDAGQ
jgi:DNA-binding response OmpR family regulator